MLYFWEKFKKKEKRKRKKMNKSKKGSHLTVVMLECTLGFHMISLRFPKILKSILNDSPEYTRIELFW